MRTAILTACICSLIVLTGCVIPAPKKVGVRGDIPESTLDFLKAGITTRDEVLLHLGLPNHANQKESVFVYNWSTAWDICASIGYGSLSCSETKKDFTLLIEFDDKGTVSRSDRQKGVQTPRLDTSWLREDADLAESAGEDAADPSSLHPVRDSCGLEEALTESNLYTDKRHGFSIQFPGDWTVTCGQDPVIVKAYQDSPPDFFFALIPDYFLEIRVEMHPVPDAAAPWSFERASLLQLEGSYLKDYPNEWHLEVMESEEVVIDEVRALRERYRVTAVNQVQLAYSLYNLGAKRFGNQVYDSHESTDDYQWVSYWYVRGDKIFQVTSGDCSFWVLQDWDVEMFGEVKDAFIKQGEIIEETLRSFRATR